MNNCTSALKTKDIQDSIVRKLDWQMTHSPFLNSVKSIIYLDQTSVFPAEVLIHPTISIS